MHKNNSIFGKIEFRKRNVYVLEGRISEEETNKLEKSGLHIYEIRHKEDDWGCPATVEPAVLVNYYGIMVTKTPFKFNHEEDKWLRLYPHETESIMRGTGAIDDPSPFTVDQIINAEIN